MVDDRNEESNNEEDHKEEEDNEDEQDYETEDEDEEDYTADDEVQNDNIEGEGDLEQLIDRSSQYTVPDVDESTNEFSRLGLLTDIVKGLASQGFTTPTPVQVCYSQFSSQIVHWTTHHILSIPTPVQVYSSSFLVKLLSNNTLTSCCVDWRWLLI